MKTQSFFTTLAIACAVVLFGAPASAAPIGTLSITSCPGGGVIVDIDTIDWVPTVNGGDGCIVTGINTSVAYSGGVLGPATFGNITDLQVPTVVPPQSEFMDFVGHPALDFNLTALGPGSNNTACAGLTQVGQSCSVFAGSPFVLTLTQDQFGNFGTSVSLAAFGVAVDSSGSSPWTGAFTTQIANRTPGAVQETILTGGSITSTHSGEFVVNAQPIPEPATLLLFGTGLATIGARVRARRRSKV